MDIIQVPEEEKMESNQPEFHAEKYQGLVPHPEHLERLHKLNPLYVDRIIKMAEEQIQSSNRDRASVIRKAFQTHILNNVAALIGAAMILFTGIHFMHKENASAGATIIVSTVVGFAGLFIIRAWKKEKTEKPGE